MNIEVMQDVKQIEIRQDFKNLLSPLTGEQLKGLEEDILARGCLQPIILWNRILIDGHNRYEICRKHKLPFDFKTMDFGSEIEVKLWIFTNQANRRNLTVYERARIALQFESYFQTLAIKNQTAGVCQNSDKGIDTKKELAKIAETSHDTIARVKAIEERASEKIKQELESQNISINRAYRDLRVSEKLEAVKSKVEDFKQKSTAAGFVDIRKTDKRYDIIYADPPWRGWEGGSKGAYLHYQTMGPDEICGLPVETIASKNCLLFLWVIHPQLQEAFKVLESWGFDYVTCGFCWIKKNASGSNFFGLGGWTRANSELCLIAIRGRPIRLDNTISQVIESVREEHSKKPAQVRDLIVRLAGDLPRIELFARQSAAGWDHWGNETVK